MAARMLAEVQAVGVQQVAEVAGHGAAAGQGGAAGAVEGVTPERVAREGQVDADLVGAPREDLHIQQ